MSCICGPNCKFSERADRKEAADRLDALVALFLIEPMTTWERELADGSCVPTPTTWEAKAAAEADAELEAVTR